MNTGVINIAGAAVYCLFCSIFIGSVFYKIKVSLYRYSIVIKLKNIVVCPFFKLLFSRDKAAE